MDQTVCVTLLARGKGDILIGVTGAGGTLQAVDAHDEHLVFLTYVHAVEIIRTFAKIMNNSLPL